MKNRSRNSTKPSFWQTSPELPTNVFKAWQKQDGGISPVAIVATVDPDGSPRAVPFGSLRAINPHLLRLCSFHQHNTYANIRRDRRVTIVMISPPDVSVSVLGRARVVREQMEHDEHFAIIDIDVEQVKNDMAYRIVIDNGITIHAKTPFEYWYETTMSELEEFEA
jgi:hypothetical protein